MVPAHALDNCISSEQPGEITNDMITVRFKPVESWVKFLARGHQRWQWKLLGGSSHES